MLNDALVRELKDIVGPKGWLSEAGDVEPHVREWRDKYHGKTALVVFPTSTADVSKIISACEQAGVTIVPQGGNTGMCGGAVPDASATQIVLCLGRMNAIRSIDAANFSMEVEAGCILQHVQDAARGANRLFALSLGAEGSCQIGGNLATNAGGINVLRYGTARAQVLGLQAVLADGTIVSSLRSLRKDTAGYDLKQLFIGSEGTLGIITAATLKLFPLPASSRTVVAALPNAGAAVQLLATMRAALSDVIESFELMSAFVISLVEKHIPDCELPFVERAPWYVLLDAAVGSNHEPLLAVLEQAMTSGIVLDAVVAKNEGEAQRLWRMRHSIAEAEKAYGKAQKHDIAVPVSRMEEFLQLGDTLLGANFPEAQLIAFGHVGDGNLHYNVALSADSARAEELTDAIYDLVDQLGGSFSAEHGVGVAKRDYLTKYRQEGEIELMKRLKSALDPKNILNPGKVI